MKSPVTPAAEVSREAHPVRGRVLELLPALAAVCIVGALVWPRLPPGICFGDSGGLQLAAATLGITHPPGYPGYVSIGHLFTYLPGLEAAFGVTLACFLSGLCVIALCAMTQIKLGVSPWAAAAVSLLLTAHTRFWSGLIAPEVYVPTLALMAGAAYLLILYARLGLCRYLFSAALLLGFALANRPPVVLALPFFVAGWWLADRGRGISKSQAVRSATIVVLLGAAPTAYSFGYLWVRDRPGTAYNYIQEYNAEYENLPEFDAGAGAKLERVVWQMSAEQFRSNVEMSWSGIRLRLRWLWNQIPLRPGSRVIVTLLAFGGAVLVWQRSRTGCVVLIGMAASSIAFVCAYRVYGSAADFLPLLYSIAVLVGVMLRPLFPRHGFGNRTILGGVLFVLVAGWTILDAPSRRASNADATHFVDGANVSGLPRNAVICTTWDHSAPLRFAKHVLYERDDITIVNARSRAWQRLVARLGDRPVFATRQGGWAREAWAREGTLWRLRR
jgi:hypothetical protein